MKSCAKVFESIPRSKLIFPTSRRPFAKASNCQLEQLDLYSSILDKLPEIRAVVVWSATQLPEKYAKDSRFFTFNDFLEVGSKITDSQIEQIM